MVIPAGFFLGVPLVRSYLQTDGELRAFQLFAERAVDLAPELAELAPSDSAEEVARRCRWLAEALVGAAWEGGHVPTIRAALAHPDDPGDASALHQIWRFSSKEFRAQFVPKKRSRASETDDEDDEDDSREKRARPDEPAHDEDEEEEEEEDTIRTKRGRDNDEDNNERGKRSKITRQRQDLPPAPQDAAVEAEWLEPLAPEEALAVRQGVPLLEILAVARLWRDVDESALLRAVYVRDLEEPPPLVADSQQLRALYARALFQAAARMALLVQQHGTVLVSAHAGPGAAPLFIVTPNQGITRASGWRGRLPPGVQRAWDAVQAARDAASLGLFFRQVLLKVTAHAVARTADRLWEAGVAIV